MESFGKKVSNLLRSLVWFADYGLFLLVNPFKFKRKPENFKSILVVEMLYIGDVIVITPSIRALKQKYHDAKITAMVLPSMVDVLSGNPNVDSIISFSPDDLRYKFSRIAHSLKGKYDLAVIFHPGIDIGSYTISKLLYKAGIPFRVGSTKVGFREGKGFFLHRKTVPTFRLKHKIDDNLDVVRLVDASTDDKHIEVFTTPESDEYVDKILKKNKVLPDDFLVVIQAAPRHKTHEWFDDRFAKLADELIAKYNAKVVFAGSIENFVPNNNIIGMMNNHAVNLAGVTDLKQLFSLVKRAKIAVSVDTGLMHVAAALDRPVVALFGAGNPTIWRPYSEKALYIFKDGEVCTSCMKHQCSMDMECMKAIRVDDVLVKVQELLK
ncbi:MAG: glycosyltransferase family 9 protein [archaeon]